MTEQERDDRAGAGWAEEERDDRGVTIRLRDPIREIHPEKRV